MSFGGDEGGGGRSNNIMKLEVRYESNWLDLVVTSHATFGINSSPYSVPTKHMHTYRLVFK